MFVAYDMLSKQYGYGISKLYPSTLDNIEEQQKVFQELLSTFEEKKILKPKTVTDTSSKTLIKYRSAGEKIKKLISEENTPLKDDILSEIKKLEHTSNTSTIKESLKNIIGKIQQHSNASIEKKLKPIAQDIGVFIAPSFLRKIGIKTRDFCTFITPIIHPQEILAVALPEKQKHTYEDIQNNSHIHILLQKKYQHMGIMNFSDEKSRQSYFYTVFRRNTWMFIFRKTLKATKHILF